MKVNYHRNFINSFKKRISPDRRLVKEFQDTLWLFLEEPDNPILDDHPLKKRKLAGGLFPLQEMYGWSING